MTDAMSAARRVGPVAALWARWWLALGLIVVGAAVGFGVAANTATQYTSESRLAVGNQDLSSYEVAGFAAAAESLASNYARYVDDSSTISASLTRALGSQVDDVVTISASPIPYSNVVSVEVVATRRGAANIGARAIARALVSLTATSPDQTAAQLLKRYTTIAGKAQAAATAAGRLSKQLKTAEGHDGATSSLRRSAAEAESAADSLSLQKTALGLQYQSAVTSPPAESSLHIIQDAAVIEDSKQKTQEIDTVAGAVVGFFVALVLANLLERRRERRRRKATPSPQGVRRHRLDGPTSNGTTASSEMSSESDAERSPASPGGATRQGRP